MTSSLDRRIIATLAYSSLFSFPLSFSELSARLVSQRALVEELNQEGCRTDLFKTKLVGNAELKSGLKRLEKQGLVKHQEDYWLLSVDENKKLPEKRLFKQQVSQNLRENFTQIIATLKSLPQVRAAAATGSLAVGNAVPDDDIDLMMVAESGALWKTRLSVLRQTRKKGSRVGESDGKPGWCCNLWLELDALKLPAGKRNLFTAYQVMQTEWLYDPDGLESEWINNNLWAQAYLPNLLQSKEINSSSKQALSKEKYSWGCSLTNIIAYGLQKIYLTTVTGIPSSNLKLKQAFLHKFDSQQLILAKWRQKTRRSFAAA